MYVSLSGQACPGLSTLAGMPSQLLGTWYPNTGSVAYSTPNSFPFNTALSRARVYAMLIRLPTP
jgi:hypothetical protein